MREEKRQDYDELVAYHEAYYNHYMAKFRYESQGNPCSEITLDNFQETTFGKTSDIEEDNSILLLM